MLPGSLSNSYEGLNRDKHFFKLDIDGKPKNVAVSRLLLLSMINPSEVGSRSEGPN